jgi:hypothetical protein
MTGLLSIAPSTEVVTINGTALPVPGVSSKGLAYLLGKFPALRLAMAGRQVTAGDWQALGGDMVAAIIAAGIGYPGDPDQEEAAANLPAGIQLDLLEKIIKVTMPEGPIPFIERATAMLGDVVPSDTVPATKSRKASRR